MSRSELPPVALLAGGLATRLQPITEKIPKSLVEVAGRPFIVHQMALLRESGIRRLVICAGYLGEQIVDLIGDGRKFGLRVDYSFDGDTLLGTGGALKKAASLLDQNFFVLYGDSYLECDYGQAYQSFRRSGKLGLMTVYRNEGRWDTSNVIFADGEILAYDKERLTSEMHYLDYGLGIFQRTVLAQIPDNQPYDLAHLYRTLLQQESLAGYEVAHRFYEIGSPQGLAETDRYLSEKIGAYRRTE